MNYITSSVVTAMCLHREREESMRNYMRHAITSIVPRSSQHPGKTALSEQKLLQAINKAVKTTLKITTK